MPPIAPTLDDDEIIDEQVFAVQEGAAFVNGDGSNKPKGFLQYTTIANGSWIWGDIGYVATGVAGAFPASNPSDVLIDLIYALKAGYRQNAVFVMNRSRVVKVMRRSAREVTHRMPERVTGIFRASVFNSRATCPNCGAFILIAHMRQTRRPRTRWSFGGKSQPEGLSEV